MAQDVRIGILGCGTVARGVLELISRSGPSIAARLGERITVAGILVRTPRVVPGVADAAVTTDPEQILGDPSIDIVVELIGGLEPAGTWVRRAIAERKGVVTANKALIAAHGVELLHESERAGTDLGFEAAVAGGIPIIRTLREALASDRVLSLVGIVNGTCNLVLSRMSDESGIEFETALREAQQKGFAEADPSLDVDGLDAAHKLAILAWLAFGAELDARAIHAEGIREITPADIAFARRFGFVVKSLAIGKDLGDRLDLRVHPTLIPARRVLASVSGALNAVWLEGESLGPCLLSGHGAGGLPTAVSVVSDVIDIARRRRSGAAGKGTRLGSPAAPRPVQPIGEVRCRYFLRMTVQDRPGVLARIAGALGAHDVSIEQMVQEGHGSAEPVQLVMLTHVARERDVRDALGEIDALTVVSAPSRLIRIES